MVSVESLFSVYGGNRTCGCGHKQEHHFCGFKRCKAKDCKCKEFGEGHLFVSVHRTAKEKV